MDTEPLFIPEGDELRLFRTEKLPELRKKYQTSQINLAFKLLKHTLYNRYNSCQVSKLVKDANSSLNESDKISKCIVESFSTLNWSRNTEKIAFYMLKTILSHISISENFINKLSIDVSTKRNKYDPSLILNRKYTKISDDDPVKKRIISWIFVIRTNSNNKSPMTLKSIINFYLNKCIPILGIDIEKWNLDNVVVNQQVVETICSTLNHFNWFSLFCKHILNKQEKFDKNFLNIDKGSWKEFHSGDKHTISATELDLIYAESQKSLLFDKLMFLVFITTGMRVGGFVRIKLNHVCSITGNDIKIFSVGRTLEKWNKWFEFPINPTVKELLYQWIYTKRKGNSDYLFPSGVTQTGYISTNTVRAHFRKLCNKANISGSHLHVHSLRHSYAHILLNCGNNISDISKLMNHSDTQTTEQFYLKESISEVVKRANIPWLDPDNKPDDVIPKFLSTEIKKREKKKERRTRRLETINNFLK